MHKPAASVVDTDTVTIEEDYDIEDEIIDEDMSDSTSVSFSIGSSFSIDGTTVYVEENRQSYICLRSHTKLSNFQMMAIYEIAPKDHVYFFDHVCQEYCTGEDDYAAVQDVFGSVSILRFDIDKTVKRTDLLDEGYSEYNPSFE